MLEYLNIFPHLSEAGNQERFTSRATDSIFNREDLEASPCASSCLLPVQYFDQLRRPIVDSGEEALMFAVLEDALRRYLRGAGPRSPRERQELAELERWFEGRDQSGIFAFETLCEAFGIEPRDLREALQTQRARMRAQGPRYKPLQRLRRPPVRSSASH